MLALAACTNVAHAMQRDPTLHTKWKELVILGGAFQVSGNVSPAAEANIFGDPEAADFVLSVGENIWMVGLDVTHSCVLTGEQLKSLNGVCLSGMLQGPGQGTHPSCFGILMCAVEWAGWASG